MFIEILVQNPHAHESKCIDSDREITTHVRVVNLVEYRNSYPSSYANNWRDNCGMSSASA